MPIYNNGDIYYRHGCVQEKFEAVAEMRQQFFIVKQTTVCCTKALSSIQYKQEVAYFIYTQNNCMHEGIRILFLIRFRDERAYDNKVGKDLSI